VLFGEDAECLDCLWIVTLESLGKPVLYGVADCVVLGALDAGFQVLCGLDQLVFNLGLGLSLPLESLALTVRTEPERNGSGVSVTFFVDGSFVLPIRIFANGSPP
jgi:hypothetical protein